MTEQVTVAWLTPSLTLIHRADVDPPAAATTSTTAAQAELLGARWCPDCRGAR